MIALLKGMIEIKDGQTLVIDAAGVGYEVTCSGSTMAALGEVGDDAKVYVETVMRQDSLELYGFASVAEKEAFLMLTKVQGVGMKVALAILSIMTPDMVYDAIHSQEKEAFARADGVGPKLAQRIVLELKDKVKKMGWQPSGTLNTSASSGVRVMSSLSTIQSDAASALQHLGYRQSDASDAIKRAANDLGDDADLNDLIRQGLSYLSKGK